MTDNDATIDAVEPAGVTFDELDSVTFDAADMTWGSKDFAWSSDAREWPEEA